ncbi:MAG: glycosyltransferase, partial [Chloroflexota bacterium]|nr:glycosyltransferase [Chloroflexota bacterium]
MRIGLIGPVPPELGGASHGGVATHQAHLAAGLAACRELQVALLATNARRPAGRIPNDLPFALARLDVPDRVLGLLSPGYLARVGPGRLLRYAADLAARGADGSRREVLANLLAYGAFLDRARPDVVHVQHPLERMAYLRRVSALEGRRWPVVVTAHSLFGEHAEDVIHGLMADNLRAADRVIAVSPHVAQQALSLGVDASRVRVIRSGVDVDHFRPRDRGSARLAAGVGATTPLVLFVGNLEPRKQVDVLLRAFALVRGHLSDAQLVVIGTGHSAGAEDQTGRLQALAIELGLGSVVRFEGHVSPPALLEWYAAADVFALPSSSEAQGIAALEAMACGLPVVASAVGGLPGTVQDGRTGWLVPSGDSAALAARLLELLRDPARCGAMGQAARDLVAREFSWQRAINATVEVYRELLATSIPRRGPSVLVVPLGETPHAEVERALSAHFSGRRLDWLDRSALRRHPWRVLPRLWARRYADAVLVAPDLSQPRLALTSFLLAVARARRHWRIDLRGGREPFDVRG